MRKLPTNIKRLKGTLRPHRENQQEVQPEACLPPCPSFLSDEAKKEYRRLGRELLALRLISKVDRAALAMYCELYSKWSQAELMLKTEGLMTSTPNGYEQPSPWYAIAKQSMEMMMKLTSEFGMTPASRSRVVPIPGKPRENLLSRFLEPRGVVPIRGDPDESA